MKNQYKNKNIIGSDETGVGDYFTPLVGASVYLTYDQALKLEEMGVKDSKELTNKQIEFFASEIKKLDQFETHYLSARGYNKLTKFFNAHELKTLIHLTTINKLQKRFKSDNIIVDKYVSEEKWKEYETKLSSSVLKIPKVKEKIIFEFNGEKEHVAVAAASILARNFMMNKMRIKNKEWETEFPLGASAKVIKFGKQFVEDYGKNHLYNVAKVSFKTTKDILGETK